MNEHLLEEDKESSEGFSTDEEEKHRFPETQDTLLKKASMRINENNSQSDRSPVSERRQPPQKPAEELP